MILHKSNEEFYRREAYPKQDKPISANDKEGETRAFAYWLFALWDHILVEMISSALRSFITAKIEFAIEKGAFPSQNRENTVLQRFYTKG